LRDQALVASAQLPAAYRHSFVNGFTTASQPDLEGVASWFCSTAPITAAPTTLPNCRVALKMLEADPAF
jgi:hypothetical protein